MTPFLLDFLPLLAFYGAYYVRDLYAATAAGIVASALCIGWTLLKRQQVRATAWISFALIAVFGGLTLMLHDSTFIKWKPTVLYWLFCLILALGPRLAGRNFIRALLEREMRLPDRLWGPLNAAWAGFFGLLGALNLVVAFSFSERIWINFKVFGTLILIMAFVVAQVLVLQRHLPRGEES